MSQFHLNFHLSSIIDAIRLDILQKRPTTPTLKKHTIDYLKNDTKSFEYTLSVLANLEAQTRREIERLGGNKGLEAIMDFLHVDETKFAWQYALRSMFLFLFWLILNHH